MVKGVCYRGVGIYRRAVKVVCVGELGFGREGGWLSARVIKLGGGLVEEVIGLPVAHKLITITITTEKSSAASYCSSC
jgi:hypothetical protein